MSRAGAAAMMLGRRRTMGAAFDIDTYFGSSLRVLLDARSWAAGTYTDQSGNGNHFTQATGGLQPAAGTAINGHATRAFDGVDDVVVGPTLATVGLSVSSHLTVVSIFRTNASLHAASGNVWVDRQTWGDANGIIGESQNTTPRAWDFDTTYRLTTTLSMSASTVYASRWIKDGTGIRYKLTGQSEVVASAATGNLNSVGGALWLGRTFGSAYGDMELAFFMVLDRAMTGTEETDLSAYLLATYGVAS